jgi:hypothetical protein
VIRVGRLPGDTHVPDHSWIQINMVTDWRGVCSAPLFPNILDPICAPAPVAEDTPHAAAELARFPLIQVTTRQHEYFVAGRMKLRDRVLVRTTGENADNLIMDG